MSDINSVRAFEMWRESSEKFDYFMAGLGAAIVGYLVPKVEATVIGFNTQTLELLAVLSLIGSTYAGIKRIEHSVHLMRVTTGRLEQVESAGRFSLALHGTETRMIKKETGVPFTQEELQDLLKNRETLVEIAKVLEKNIGDKYERMYKLRTGLLIGGFLLILAARIWGGYHGLVAVPQ